MTNFRMSVNLTTTSTSSGEVELHKHKPKMHKMLEESESTKTDLFRIFVLTMNTLFLRAEVITLTHQAQTSLL